MSITFVSGPGNRSPLKKTQKDTSKEETKKGPEAFKEKRDLVKQKQDIEKKIRSLSAALRYTALRMAADPNDDPNYLFEQVRPILSKMNIHGKADKGKTSITEQTDSKGNRLYRIQLRREENLSDNEIERIKREKDSFEKIDWDPKGMMVFVWGPYKDPAGQQG
jgi:hypothetical protein